MPMVPALAQFERLFDQENAQRADFSDAAMTF
jgi:hypothetical protein